MVATMVATWKERTRGGPHLLTGSPVHRLGGGVPTRPTLGARQATMNGGIRLVSQTFSPSPVTPRERVGTTPEDHTMKTTRPETDAPTHHTPSHPTAVSTYTTCPPRSFGPSGV